MFKLKIYHGYHCSHFLIFPSLFYSFAPIDCDAYIFLLEMYSCDLEHQRRKRGKSGSARDHFLTNEVCIQALKPSRIFLSPIVRVPLFGGLSWKLKEAVCVIEKKKSESCVETYLDSSSGFGLCIVQF